MSKAKKYLEFLIEDAKVTRSEIAKNVKVNVATIRRWLGGEEPTSNKLEYLYQFYLKKADELGLDVNKSEYSFNKLSSTDKLKLLVKYSGLSRDEIMLTMSVTPASFRKWINGGNMKPTNARLLDMLVEKHLDLNEIEKIESKNKDKTSESKETKTNELGVSVGKPKVEVAKKQDKSFKPIVLSPRGKIKIRYTVR